VVRKVLLVQLRQLGDILLTTPVTRALHDLDPTVEISFLSHSMGRLILEGNPYIKKTFYYNERDSLGLQFQLFKSLRQEHFTDVIDFMNNPRSALFTWLTGARVRIGFQSARSWAYNRLAPRAPSAAYIVREKLQLLDHLGLSTVPWDLDSLIPVIPLSPADYQKPMSFLKSIPQPETPRVVISPTHRRAERRWPLAAYAALADDLTLHWKARVFWLWGPGEETFVDQCLGLCQQKTLKTPPTSFREMAAFVENSDLFIGNSNGPSHVAVGVQTPSLQLHGPTDGRSWCPSSGIHQFIQAKTMSEIPVNEVQAAVKNLWPQVLQRVQTRLHKFNSL
jgi:ADP-heptose:LPS heptosyltransferase